MEAPDDQTQIVRTWVFIAILLLFIGVIDPLLLWAAIGVVVGVTWWMAYLLWLFILALAATHFLIRKLLEDEDKPPTVVRRVGRIL